MNIPLLKTFKTLLGYLLVAFFLISPFGWVFIIQLPFINKCKYCLNTWYLIDVLICHACHATGRHRTISGWTGQHMHNKKRYYYQAKLIDFLFIENHCINAYQSELNQGYV